MVVLAALPFIASPAAAIDVTIPATSNIFAAGQVSATSCGGGTIPVEIVLSPCATSVRFPSVTGTMTAGTNWPAVGPEGGTTTPWGPRTTNILSACGTSGILHNRFMFLTGVFLTDDVPTSGAEPARLNFTGIDSFLTLSPLLHQTFFIGDGLTGNGTGQVQEFIIPAGATRLFLGIADSFDFGHFNPLPPAAYGDNAGAFDAVVELVSGASIADLNGDCVVGVPDLLILLANWGPCGTCTPAACPADLDGSCAVGVADLLILLANWG